MCKKMLRIWSVIVWRVRKRFNNDRMLEDWWMDGNRPHVTKYD